MLRRFALATMVAMPVTSVAAARDSAVTRFVSLECDNVRRLSDNYLLDLRIRMVFDRAKHRYLRFENAGRGWQMVGTYPLVGVDASRITLDDGDTVTAYIERLTGDFYSIDRSGLTLSLWGRCNHVGRLAPLF